ncbi:bystin family U3 and U14 snoRNA associated protein [Schizosaccharomyces japonicus yFS275]|uniref:Bystin family U3 and U14 snoRNA associated protein n=1 Tax=Schizosaccharomyces japonicus (strain yFS275 / FY16936) TaxID=402676 RepID=B6JWX2_SCHJY|nr:bystin family U3 and U14 snoRNA associated protein [Schizosaccharomyces japonicus yFS275]EEB05873.1 bystin family U3 and U14 snoRNA associated protein [Schizosaccharomyces japonicus yFS275]
MPKAPKVRLSHVPLHQDIEKSREEGILRTKTSKPQKSGKKKANAEFLDAKSSKKILRLAREQAEEIEQEENAEGNAKNEGNSLKITSLKASSKPEAASVSLSARDSLSNPQIEDEDDDSDDANYGSDNEFVAGEEEDEYEEFEIDEGDKALFDKFLPETEQKPTNLSNLIMQKIQEAEARARGELPVEEEEESGLPPLPPKVIEVYSKVGLLLSRYRSGKIPKAFKIIPNLSNWEDILYLTRPDTWTPHAVYQATRIFVSNLKPLQAQRFLTTVLLERVREDIRDGGKLNYHLYMALKKGLYKPAAWFKGFLFPLLQEGCTLREAAIVGSVLTKVSVPVLHSAAALLRLTEFEMSGAQSLFIRILLDKKYALPYKVVDALVFYFLRWKSIDRPLAVLEHQSLLVFAQRYKHDITPEQKDALLEVVIAKGHYSIGPEIRRELANSTSRGEEIPDEEMQL